MTPWCRAQENLRHIPGEYVYTVRALKLFWKKTGRTSEKFARSDQDGIDVKIDVKGKVLIRYLGKAICGRFRHQGEIRWRVRWLTLKGGEPITETKSRVGLTSPPPVWQHGGWGQACFRGEPIRGHGRREEEEGRGMSGGYRRQGDPFSEWVVSWHR